MNEWTNVPSYLIQDYSGGKIIKLYRMSMEMKMEARGMQEKWRHAQSKTEIELPRAVQRHEALMDIITMHWGWLLGHFIGLS